jgi:acetolactate decarboxylase
MIGCTQQRATSDVLYQASTFNGLMEGVYDGPTTIGELRQHGDFGIGTFNSLNGEMVGFDGRFYQVRSDGKAYPVSDDVKTPFASVKFFQPDRSAVISKDMDFEQLQKFLNALVPTENIFYAIRIDGTFSYVRTRSVPMQKRPYPRLVEVVKTQPTFEFHNVKGTIVGYRLPPYVNGLNIAGYHLHFLTENADAGGHLLECRIEKASVKMDDCTQFFLNLPQQEDFSKVNLTTQKHEEINKIEH